MAVLRVLSYNVRVLRDDVAAVVRVVRAARPHVVFVQESPAMWRWRARNAELARRCRLVVAAGGGGAAAGNLILTSLAVDAYAGRSIPLRRLLFRRRRGAAAVECRFGGVRFTAVGTHLSTDPAERGMQFRGLLEALPADACPVILGADMNEQADGDAWSAAVTRFTDAGAADPTPTFSCSSPRRRIDGIFVDPRLRVLRYRVLDSPDVRVASDHFPIYTEVELST